MMHHYRNHLKRWEKSEQGRGSKTRRLAGMRSSSSFEAGTSGTMTSSQQESLVFSTTNYASTLQTFNTPTFDRVPILPPITKLFEAVREHDLGAHAFHGNGYGLGALGVNGGYQVHWSNKVN
jgi:hypothetical protein